jgi:hypothetical protein
VKKFTEIDHPKNTASKTLASTMMLRLPLLGFRP